MTSNLLDSDESLMCEFCGKVIRRAGFRGPLKSQLEYHQKTRECLRAYAQFLKREVEKEKVLIQQMIDELPPRTKESLKKRLAEEGEKILDGRNPFNDEEPVEIDRNVRTSRNWIKAEVAPAKKNDSSMNG